MFSYYCLVNIYIKKYNNPNVKDRNISRSFYIFNVNIITLVK